MGKVRIVLRDIRVPLFGQFPETCMDAVQARPARNAKHVSSFGNIHGKSSGHWWTVGVRI